MPRHRFVQVDVFTEHAFEGNPLAVFPAADELSDDEMQSVAREMNLSETVFVTASKDARALRRLRIFTPTMELPLAGHPVVGAWNVLARAEYGALVLPPAGGNSSVRILHELGVGVLPVEIVFKDDRPARVVMTQAAFTIGATITDVAEQREIAASLGLRAEDFDDALPIQIVATGIPTLVIPLRSLSALGRCQIDAARLAAAYTRADAFSLYAFTRQTHNNDAAAHARLFAPDGGIAEDPATGSAAGSLGAYLVHHGALERTPHRAEDDHYGFKIEQGDFIKRPSRIEVEVAGATGDVREVRVGGAAVVVIEGELIL